MSGNVDTQYASQLTDYELSTKFLDYSLIWEVLVLAPGILAIPAAVWYSIASNEDSETRKAKSVLRESFRKHGRKLVNSLRMSNANATWQTGVGLDSLPKHTAERDTIGESTIAATETRVAENPDFIEEESRGWCGAC